MSRDLFAPRAARDLVTAADFIARENRDSGEAFVRAAIDAAGRLSERPLLGHTDRNLPGRYRFWSLTRFSYVMVYDASVVPIRILRILHTARDLRVVLKPLAGQ